MDSSIFRISLDVHQQATQIHLAVKKGDTARKIVAALSNGGRPYLIREDCHAVFKGKKPDGHVLYNDCTIVNNCIVYEFTEQTAASAGYMHCELQLYGPDGKIITSPRFAITVSGMVYDDSEVESSDEFTALAEAMTALAELKANGLKGDPGDSAYDEAVSLGFEGSEAEWLESLTGPEGPPGPKGETPLRVELILGGEGGWAADVEYAAIRQEYDAGRQIICCLEQDRQWLELPLVKEADGVFTFGAVVAGEEWRVVLGPAEEGNAAVVAVTSTPCSQPPLYVTLRGNPTAGYSADVSYEQILEAHRQERAVYCLAGSMVLSLSGADDGTAMFQANNRARHHRAAIRADGTVQSETFLFALAEDLVPEATDEIYFEITPDGVISLRPEYRGEVPASVADKPDYAAALSDRGGDLAGTRNRELPEEIVIPAAVGGIAVTAYAYAMFLGNKRVRKLTLLPGITEIPGYFCYNTWGLRTVQGTENVETLSKYAFANSGILAAAFPGLKEISDGAFSGCCDMAAADIGNTVTAIPPSCFSMCQRLEVLRNASAVTSIGKSGFMDTYRLQTLPFLANLTSIGDYGLTISRLDYDWDSLENCVFGTWATARDFCGGDYWSACEFTPCNTPVRSVFHQDDPRWVDKQIGNLDRTWDTGCIIVCAAMAYSALEGVDLASPEEFTELVYAADASLKDVDPGTQNPGIERYLAAVGYEATLYGQFNTANLQAMYDALAEGAVVIHRCLAGKNNGNHDVLIHGINAGGEVLCVDPGALSERIGEYEALTYAMPIQNRTRAAEGADKDWFWVIRKK